MKHGGEDGGRPAPRRDQLVVRLREMHVTVRFDCGDASLRPGQVGGLVLRAAGDPLQVVASITATDTVTLLLAAPAPAPLTVSLGSGREAAGLPVPVEDSPWALPALVFVDTPVVTPVVKPVE